MTERSMLTAAGVASGGTWANQAPRAETAQAGMSVARPVSSIRRAAMEVSGSLEANGGRTLLVVCGTRAAAPGRRLVSQAMALHSCPGGAPCQGPGLTPKAAPRGCDEL
ncbi:MAG: hypothetical protein PHG96_00245 [Kiritimatiellae bacterium]|nr:hypothetical protein [Kiritimatiellia bacterium]